MRIVKLTNAEMADIIRALEEAQARKMTADGSLQDTAQWERWETLIQRFKYGAIADG